MTVFVALVLAFGEVSVLAVVEVAGGGAVSPDDVSEGSFVVSSVVSVVLVSVCVSSSASISASACVSCWLFSSVVEATGAITGAEGAAVDLERTYLALSSVLLQREAQREGEQRKL